MKREVYIVMWKYQDAVHYKIDRIYTKRKSAQAAVRRILRLGLAAYVVTEILYGK